VRARRRRPVGEIVEGDGAGLDRTSEVQGNIARPRHGRGVVGRPRRRSGGMSGKPAWIAGIDRGARAKLRWNGVVEAIVVFWEGTMKRVLLGMVVLGALAGGSMPGLAEDVLGFGFGGGGVAAFVPDLEGVNVFLSENGLAPMVPDVLFGGCGGGRGGIIGGPSLGGMGFGVAAESSSFDRRAELVIGAGGFDLGYAVGGDGASVLTLGAVLGGGAAVLDLTFSGVEPAEAGAQGIIPEPVTRTVGRAFAMVMPYVSLEAQLMSFVGFDLRIGYLLPVFGLTFGEVVGIPTPSLDLSGPYVSLSIVFGGIAKAGGSVAGLKAATASGTLSVPEGTRLSLENAMGSVAVSSVQYSEIQTGSRRVVEWSAVLKEDADFAGNEFVEAASGPAGASLRTTAEGEVDYVLRVPPGTDLELVNGAGAVHIVGHSASAVRISLGAGEISLFDIDARELELSVGVGQIDVSARAIGSLSAHAGVGRILLELPPDSSATISASAGIGDTSISGFSGMTLREQGFLWTRAADAVLGSGLAVISLSTGIGAVEVRSLP
jgi:hypothetical protein